MNYIEKIQQSITENRSCLSVGLDPNLDRIPASLKEKTSGDEELVYTFLETVIDVTSDHCAAYKPNLGFFEALGKNGLEVFERVIAHIPSDKIIIADAKRGDISSTASHYAKAYFEEFDVDALTINPLMGFESLDPFLNYSNKGIYTLALTSNPGAEDFLMQPFANESSMAAYISKKLALLQEDSNTHLGMVVGATKAHTVKNVISHHRKGSLLIPGIGAQGGSVQELAETLQGHQGLPLINSSRSILYAGENKKDWKLAIAEQARITNELLEPITKTYV